MIQPILHPNELADLVIMPDVILVDAGDSITYATQHLKGAVYVDLNADLANVPENPANGGRHPLPDVVEFGNVLARLGITPQSHVVVYDDKSGALSAARFWWMLRAVGHEKVQVLNGGLSAAVKEGFPLSDVVELREPAERYVFNEWLLPLAFIDEVEAAAADNSRIVIDVRAAARYEGKTEPIDSVAGHIPGAVNMPYDTNLDTDGFFLPPNELEEKYRATFGNITTDKGIIHCGSGVTACHTLLAMDYAAMPLPKLYVGSWSEWSGNGRQVAVNV